MARTRPTPRSPHPAGLFHVQPSGRPDSFRAANDDFLRTSADVIPRATTRILLALHSTYAIEGRATVRDVARAARRSIGVAHLHLQVLRDAGLVTWEDGRAGTLRPCFEIHI